MERGINRLRKDHIVAKDAHGRVMVRFTVTPGGNAIDPVIKESSGVPAVDSMAMNAVALGRYLAPVIGRHAVRGLMIEPISF